MPIDLKQYERLRRKADDLKREVDKAEGALEQLIGRLESEFDCKTLAQAQKMLKKLSADEAKASKKYESDLAEFEEEWGKVLERTVDDGTDD